jgi:hypothetical protein
MHQPDAPPSHMQALLSDPLIIELLQVGLANAN